MAAITRMKSPELSRSTGLRDELSKLDFLRSEFPTLELSERIAETFPN